MYKSPRWRAFLYALTVARIVIGLIAIPLAPFLYREHFVVLVLLRPTKEVLLVGGFLVRLGEVQLLPLLAAAVPLAILGVWQMYFLGRQYADKIDSGRMPKLARRILPRDRIRTMQKLLDRKGKRVVLLGRLAPFPSTLVAAAAGSGRMKPSEFLPVDTLGGLLSIAEVVGAGFGLGYAYKSAGPWITALGAAALIGAGVIVGRFLRRQ